MAARYLYAIVPKSGANGSDLRGIDDQPVYAIESGPVAAVVSDVQPQRVRPERRNLKTHQDVLASLMKKTTVLPMRFGMVAGTAAEVKKTLARLRERFVADLERVDGKVEMGLKVLWNVPNIFEFFVAKHPDLREARDQIYGSGEPTRDEKVELGRLFERLLGAERERHTAAVEQALSKICAEIRPSRTLDDKMVMNLACLIERNAEAKFQSAVESAAKDFDQNYTFDFSGPWAPHSFVDAVVSVQ